LLLKAVAKIGAIGNAESASGATVAPCL